MTRVALVVTGRLEYLALAAALGRLFPGVDFRPFELDRPEEELFDSTSVRVDPERIRRAAEEHTPPKIDELIERLAGALSSRDAADFAFLVEDLELCNRGNEPGVLLAVREAVERHLARTALRRHAPRDLATRLRERASFHLFDPMLESYLYDDPRALSTALGAAPTSSARAGAVLRATGRDPERFLVLASDDPDYFAPVGECTRHHRKKDRRCPWGGEDRGEHPKKYLKYLTREPPPEHFCAAYKETSHGADALRALAWNSVLSPSAASPFLRALVEDLEDALGRRPALPGWPDTPASTAPTARSRAPAIPVLRNV